MRIWKVGLTMAVVSSCIAPLGAQTVSSTAAGNSIVATNGAFVGVNPLTVVNPQSITPNLASSNATPAIGQPGITPAMPRPGTTAISPQGVGGAIQPEGGFTTGIGRQDTVGSIGRQNTTAIGQQGSGTAIGQQGVGTAIIPPTNAIVIGQPEPFSAPAVSTPSAIGFSTNMPNVLGPETFTNSGHGLTGGVPRTALPAAAPMNRAVPAGRR